MLSVLTLNHRMHTGSFLTKVTRNRAIDLHCIQQEIMKTLLDTCVSLQCLQVAGEHRGQAVGQDERCAAAFHSAEQKRTTAILPRSPGPRGACSESSLVLWSLKEEGAVPPDD